MNDRRPWPTLGRDLPVWWEPGAPCDDCARPSERTVLLLYGEALAALRRARRLGDPRADLGRALSILTELAASLAEREEIALLRVQRFGLREIGRRLGRSASSRRQSSGEYPSARKNAASNRPTGWLRESRYPGSFAGSMMARSAFGICNR